MNQKKKDILLTVIKCSVAMTIFVVAIAKYDVLSNIDVVQIVSFTQNYGIIIAVVIGIYLLKAIVFVVPASVIYVAVGVVLPSWLAVTVNLVGILLEVSVTYWLGHFLGSEAVRKLLAKKPAGQKLMEKELQNKPAVLLGIRALPVFPIDFVSLFYGSTDCRFVSYALLSLIGISWRVILFTIVGSEVFDWIPTDKIILVCICCIPVGVIVYLVKKYYLPCRQMKKQSFESDLFPEE